MGHKKPPRQVQRIQNDSDKIETIKEVMFGIFRQLASLSDQISDTQKRVDNLAVMLTRDKIDEPKKTSWIPKDKKEITTAVALVVFALTILAIILASCGLVGCEGLQ